MAGKPGFVTIDSQSSISVAEQIWQESTLLYQMGKASTAVTKLLCQFGCASVSVLAKKFSSDKTGLVELNDAVKSFLSLSAGARRNARIAIETDDLSLGREISSDDDDFTSVNSDEEDDERVTLDMADRRAQEVIDCAAIDLVAAAIQLDENGDDADDGISVEPAEIVEIEDAIDEIDEMISDDCLVSCQVMQMVASLFAKKLDDDPTGMEVMDLASTTCAMMQMKKREQCSFTANRKYKTLTSRNWGHQASEANANSGVVQGPCNDATHYFIRVGSIIKLKAWQGCKIQPGTTIHVAVTAVFTSYSKKFWLRSRSEEADLIKKAATECMNSNNAPLSTRKRKRKDKEEKETRYLVQRIVLLDEVIKYTVPTNQVDVKNVFAISKRDDVDCIVGFDGRIVEEETLDETIDIEEV